MSTQATDVRGVSVVAGQDVRGGQRPFRAAAAATGEPLEPEFGRLTLDELRAATAAAADAFPTYRATTPTERADFLEAVAEEIEADADAVVQRAVAESGLPEVRLRGELARTTGQLRLFAGVARQGDHLGARLDPALPQRQPLPRPDLRQRMVPLGPVAVFGASNFPLAFSTAGGDTASALAAGCPVVVKGHAAHPGTGELVARAVSRAVERTGLPEAVFSFVLGAAPRSVMRWCRPAHQGGRLHRLAVRWAGDRGDRLAPTRAHPGLCRDASINPVFLLPGALERETRGARGRLRRLAHHGCRPVLHQPGARLRAGRPTRGRVRRRRRPSGRRQHRTAHAHPGHRRRVRGGRPGPRGGRRRPGRLGRAGGGRGSPGAC